jgi:small-conductance mechanosensitive channel
LPPPGQAQTSLGEITMHRLHHFPGLTLAAGGLIVASLLGGCASRSDVAKLHEDVSSAQLEATRAQEAAAAAQSAINAQAVAQAQAAADAAQKQALDAAQKADLARQQSLDANRKADQALVNAQDARSDVSEVDARLASGNTARRAKKR